MKSLEVSVFWPTWVWTFRPWLRWLYASYAQSLSTRDSLKCRRIIVSRWYQRLIQSAWRLTGDQNVKTRYENSETGFRLSTSVGGIGTGEGGDVVVVDDPHKVDEAESDAIRQNVIDWWALEMSTRLNDHKRGAHVIVMQRTHEADLSGYVIAETGYEHLMIPMRYEPKRRCVTSLGWQDPRTEPGELLWEERFPEAVVRDLEHRLGTRGAAGQLQQRPAPLEGNIFKRRWWRRYRELPTPVDEWIQSWDMTFKETESGSYVVGQIWARKGADCYLVHQVRGRWEFTTAVREVQLLTKDFPQARRKLIEEAANGPAVISALRRVVPGLIAVRVKGSKTARAYAVSPIVESGNVYLPMDAPWLDEFLNEVDVFDNGATDDQVDAMTQALHHLAGPQRAIGQEAVHW